MLVPFVRLAGSRIPIQIFDLRLAPGESLTTIATSLLMLAAFGSIGATIAYKALVKPSGTAPIQLGP